MTNMETITNLTNEIEQLENNINVLCEERSSLIDHICQWMARTHKSHGIIRASNATLEVYIDGTPKWWGELSRKNLDDIERSFINHLMEERASLKDVLS